MTSRQILSNGCQTLVAVVVGWLAAGAPATQQDTAPTPAEVRQGWVVNVVDGDTYDIEFRTQRRIRLVDADTWESRNVRRAGVTAAEITAELVKGKAAAKAVRDRLLNQLVIVATRPPGHQDNFGRELVRIWHDNENIGTWLEANGHTRPAD